MKILIKNNQESFSKAGVWINNVAVAKTLAALEKVIAEKEQFWGKCIAFVEFSFTSDDASKSRQIDLLLAFNSFAAICEVKGARDHLGYHGGVEETYTQVERQTQAIRAILGIAEKNKQNVKPFVWITRASRDSLVNFDRSMREVNAFHHFDTVGTEENSLDLILSGNRAAYFPLALQNAYRSNSPDVSVAYSKELQNAVERSLRNSGTELLWFDSFRKLGRHISFDATVEFGKWLRPQHLLGLRDRECTQAAKILLEKRFLEVSGPPGVGKSSFIKELLRRPEVSATLQPPLVITRAGNLRQLLETVAGESVGYAPEQLQAWDNNELIVGELARGESVFWIRDFDVESANSIDELANYLARNAAQYKALWIIETLNQDSTKLQSPRKECGISLERFETAQIMRILEKYDRLNESDDPLTVANWSEGIVERAIQRWTSPKFTPRLSGERKSPYEHFFEILSEEERDNIGPLAHLVTRAPLGCTVGMILTWCAAARPSARSERVVRGLLAKCDETQFISVEGLANLVTQAEYSGDDVGASRLVAQINADVADSDRMSVVRAIDPNFLEYAASTFWAAASGETKAKFSGFLSITGSQRSTFSGVNASLLAGDFEPFFRSTFRWSSGEMPRLKSWLDGERRSRDLSTDEQYIHEYLRWSLEHYWNRPEDDGEEMWQMMPPNAASRIQQLAYDLTRIRGVCHFNKVSGFNWQSWEAVATEFYRRGEFDFWAEATIYRAQALQGEQSENLAATWDQISKVLAETEKLSPLSGLPLLYVHLLSVLNKKTKLKGQIAFLSQDREKKMKEYALKLLDCGIRAESMASLANAVFAYVRADIGDKKVLSEDLIDAYAQLLQFVERNSPARRVQATLTRATAHRKFAEQTTEWTSFRLHADASIGLMRTAVLSAEQLGMKSQVLDTASYSGTLLKSGLRFSKEAGFHRWIKDTVPAIRKISEKYAEPLFQEDDSVRSTASHLLNIRKHAVIQHFMLFLYRVEGTPEKVLDAVEKMGEALLDLKNHFRDDKKVNHWAWRAGEEILESFESMTSHFHFAECLGKLSRELERLFIKLANGSDRNRLLQGFRKLPGVRK